MGPVDNDGHPHQTSTATSATLTTTDFKSPTIDARGKQTSPSAFQSAAKTSMLSGATASPTHEVSPCVLSNSGHHHDPRTTTHQRAHSRRHVHKRARVRDYSGTHVRVQPVQLAGGLHAPGTEGTWGLRLRLRHGALRLERRRLPRKASMDIISVCSGGPAGVRAACGASARPGGCVTGLRAAAAENRVNTPARKTHEQSRYDAR